MKKILFFNVLCLLSNMTNAQIENIIAYQNNDKVVIEYDLNSTDKNETYEIDIYVSNENSEFDEPLQNVKGDVGVGIKVGSKKTIIWQVLKERSSLIGNYKFKIAAKRINSNYSEYVVRHCDIIVEVKDIRTEQDEIIIYLDVQNNDRDIQTYFGKASLVSRESDAVYFDEAKSNFAGKLSPASIDLTSNSTYPVKLTFNKDSITNSFYSLHYYLPNECRKNEFVIPLKNKFK